MTETTASARVRVCAYRSAGRRAGRRTTPRAYAHTRALADAWRALVLLVTALLGVPAAAAADTRYIDYLYIEANEGDSSGGHVALQFGADTFHFQQEYGGLIRMRRDDAETFHFRYAMVGNRPIHETRIAVSPQTYAMLRDAFSARLLVQTAQFGRLEALQDDVDLFELWQRRAAGDRSVAVPVRGAGYFASDDGAVTAAPPMRSPALAALGAQVAAARGAAFVAARAAALRARLAAWQPRAVRDPAPALAPDAYPRFAAVAADDYREQLEGLTALEVLAAAPALRRDAYRVLTAAPPLDAQEHRALQRFVGELTADLAALAASPRGDFGYPLLLGMARLAALELSLSSGRPVVLDAFAADATDAPLPHGGQRDAYLTALAARLRPGVERSRRELFAQAHFREADYTHFESAANRWLEARQARQGAALRTAPGLLIPNRAARRGELIAPPLPAAVAGAELEQARAARTDQHARLAELYGYNLITRNCVSEIFATIDAGLAGQSEGDEASRRRLGGVVQTRFTLNFIPVVSAAAVERNYAAVAQRTRPSYRQLRLAALREQEPAWRVYLRESNTLTSTVYHPTDGDSAFLFFTDDAVALRPLFGAANLLVGIADGALGLVTWPSDAGARLLAGLRGAVFSLPELAFVNLRKGSMAWAEPPLIKDALSPRSSSSSP